MTHAISSVYGWAATRLTREEAHTVLQKRGYLVQRVSDYELESAIADPAKWRERHRYTPFNPAGVQGL